MDIKSRSVKGFFWNHLAKLTDYTLTYLLTIIAARLMGKEMYSTYVTLMSIAGASLIIGSFGLDEALNKFISQLKSLKENNKAALLVKKLLSVRIFIVTSLCFAIFIFRNNLSYFLKNKEIVDFLDVVVLYIFTQSLINFFSNYFTAILNTKIVFIVNSAIKLVNIIAVFFILLTLNDIRYLYITFIATATIGLLIYLFSNRKLLLTKKESIKLKPIFNFSLAAWFNSLLSLFLGRYSGVLMLNYFLGKNVLVGYFDVAFTISILLEYIFAAGLMGVSLSVFSELAISDKELVLNARSKLIKFHQLLMTPIAVFFIIYPEFIITFFFSREYIQAVPLLRTYLFFSIMVVAVLGSGTSVSILMSIGKQRVANLTRLCVAILSIFLYSIFIPLFKAEGAIIVAGSTYLFVCTIDFLFVNKYIGFRYDFSFLFKVLFSTFIAGAIVFFIPGTDFFLMIVKGLIYISLFVLSLYLFKLRDPIIEEIKNYFLKVEFVKKILRINN